MSSDDNLLLEVPMSEPSPAVGFCAVGALSMPSLTMGPFLGGPNCVLLFGNSGNSAKRDASPGPQSGGQAALPERPASCLLLQARRVCLSVLLIHVITNLKLVFC